MRTAVNFVAPTNPVDFGTVTDAKGSIRLTGFPICDSLVAKIASKSIYPAIHLEVRTHDGKMFNRKKLQGRGISGVELTVHCSGRIHLLHQELQLTNYRHCVWHHTSESPNEGASDFVIRIVILHTLLVAEVQENDRIIHEGTATILT